MTHTDAQLEPGHPAPPGTSRVAAPGMKEMRRFMEEGARRWRRLGLWCDTAWCLAPLLLVVWILLHLDVLVHLAVWGRVTAFLLFLAGCAVLVVCFVRGWRRRRYSHDQVALAVEQRTEGQLGNRLINSVQLARTRGPAVDSVLRENCSVLSLSALPRAASTRTPARSPPIA